MNYWFANNWILRDPVVDLGQFFYWQAWGMGEITWSSILEGMKNVKPLYIFRKQVKNLTFYECPRKICQTLGYLD